MTLQNVIEELAAPVGGLSYLGPRAGLSGAVFSNWKYGKSIPSRYSIRKLREYIRERPVHHHLLGILDDLEEKASRQERREMTDDRQARLELARVLQDYMSEQGLSPSEMAAKVDCPAIDISRMLAGGHPTLPDTIEKMMAHLHAHIDGLDTLLRLNAIESDAIQTAQTTLPDKDAAQESSYESIDWVAGVRRFCEEHGVTLSKMAREVGMTPSCFNGKLRRNSFSPAERELIVVFMDVTALSQNEAEAIEALAEASSQEPSEPVPMEEASPQTKPRQIALPEDRTYSFTMEGLLAFMENVIAIHEMTTTRSGSSRELLVRLLNLIR